MCRVSIGVATMGLLTIMDKKTPPVTFTIHGKRSYNNNAYPHWNSKVMKMPEIGITTTSGATSGDKGGRKSNASERIR